RGVGANAVSFTSPCEKSTGVPVSASPRKASSVAPALWRTSWPGAWSVPSFANFASMVVMLSIFYLRRKPRLDFVEPVIDQHSYFGAEHREHDDRIHAGVAMRG